MAAAPVPLWASPLLVLAPRGAGQASWSQEGAALRGEQLCQLPPSTAARPREPIAAQRDHIRVKFVVLLIMNVSSFLINSLLNVRSLS